MGFAWTPGGREDFVIRSSYGIFYDETPGNQLGWDAIGPERGAFSTAVSTDRRNPIQIPGLFAPAPAFVPVGYNEILDKSAPISIPTMFGPERRQPYLQIWTLSIQKALPMRMVGEAAYVGQHGLKLSKRVEPNRPLPSATDTRPIGERVPCGKLRRNFDGSRDCDVQVQRLAAIAAPEHAQLQFHCGLHLLQGYVLG